jgi:uncharacterized membrane protein
MKAGLTNSPEVGMAAWQVDWVHAAGPMTAAFLASLVEFVEALTIVLAVGTVAGWRPALSGAAAGVVLLAVLVAALGPALASVPLGVLQLALGMLLLLFGLRWLRKAVLRGAGRLPLHDEAAAFESEAAALRRAVGRAVAWTTAFKAVVIEGLEVIFIVIAVGAAGQTLVPAAAGAALAFLVVLALGTALHKPLARVPENALKFIVGTMVSGFGLFWIGEGLGFPWPGDDLAIPVLIAAWAALALLLVRRLRRPAVAA